MVDNVLGGLRVGVRAAMRLRSGRLSDFPGRARTLARSGESQSGGNRQSSSVKTRKHPRARLAPVFARNAAAGKWLERIIPRVYARRGSQLGGRSRAAGGSGWGLEAVLSGRGGRGLSQEYQQPVSDLLASCRTLLRGASAQYVMLCGPALSDGVHAILIVAGAPDPFHWIVGVAEHADSGRGIRHRDRACRAPL